jgi:hypothetical protein
MPGLNAYYYFSGKIKSEGGGMTVRGMRGARLADLGSGIWKSSALVGGVERETCPFCRGRSCPSSSIKLLGDGGAENISLTDTGWWGEKGQLLRKL